MRRARNAQRAPKRRWRTVYRAVRIYIYIFICAPWVRGYCVTLNQMQINLSMGDCIICACAPPLRCAASHTPGNTDAAADDEDSVAQIIQVCVAAAVAGFAECGVRCVLCVSVRTHHQTRSECVMIKLRAVFMLPRRTYMCILLRSSSTMCTIHINRLAKKRSSPHAREEDEWHAFDAVAKINFDLFMARGWRVWSVVCVIC